MSVRRRKWSNHVWLLFRETVRKWNADNCIRLGASLSYYTLFSLFPLILVTLTLVRFLFINSEGVRGVILDALASVTGGFRTDFEAALQAAAQTRRASGIIGTILLILGSSWVFGELVSAFNIIWGLEAPQRGGPMHFLRSTFFSFALVLSGIFLLLVSMIISAVLAALGNYLIALPGGALGWRIGHTLINLCVLSLVFALLLKYLPQTRVAWSDVWLGAVLTAIIWTLLQSAIALYIALGSYQDYGAIGAILALVAWVFLSSQVLFLGGEFTAVYAKHFGSRVPRQPSDRATARPSATATARTAQARRVNRTAGIVIGLLGTIGFTILAIISGAAQAVRRIFLEK